MTAEELARLIHVPAEKVRRHLAAGAPVDAEGRINIVQYVAWLLKQLG